MTSTNANLHAAPTAPHSPETAVPLRRSISPVELWDDLMADRVVLVDVREPVEFAGERIAGALSMPLSRLDVQTLPTSSADRPVVLYCQSGNRSGQAAARLIAADWGPAIDLAGGLNAWKAAGYAVQVDRRAPISLMRQVQIVAGSLVLIGTLLGALVSPWFLIVSGFVGAGLMFAGITNTCGLALLLAKLPYNRCNS